MEAKKIQGDCVVRVPVEAVWSALTTEEGMQSFLAPACRIELRVDGPYEPYFDPQAPAGKQGAEGVRILAFQPEKMLSITWNAPPRFPEMRAQWTHVTIGLDTLGPCKTRITLTHDGWGSGGQWDEVYHYFNRAWLQVVLPRLKHALEVGPIDWENPQI